MTELLPGGPLGVHEYTTFGSLSGMAFLLSTFLTDSAEIPN